MFERIVAFQAIIRGDAIAIDTPVGSATYDQLNRDAARMAGRLQPILPEAGEVAVKVSNPGLHWIVLLALIRLGRVSASLPLVGERPEAELLRLMKPAMLLTDTPLPDCRTALLHLSPEWVAETFRSPPIEASAHQFAPEDPVRVVLSSGTTGAPKKMVLTRRTVDIRVTAARSARTRGHAAVGLDTETGFRASLAVWAGGGTMVYPEVGFRWSEFLLNRRPDVIGLVPLQLDLLLRSLPPDFPRLDRLIVSVISGGLPPSLYERTRARLTDNIIVTYGSSEAGLIAVASPAMLARGEQGYAVTPAADVEIVDAKNRPVPFGTEGRVRARTAEMIAGYARQADTAVHFKDGWFYPGDLGVLSADGRLQILGRETEILDFGGVRIAPREIEDVLLRCEGVRDAAAFSMQADGLGRPGAAIVCELGCDLEAVQATLRRERPQFAIPLMVVDEIPRSHRGKIQREVVQRRAEALFLSRG